MARPATGSIRWNEERKMWTVRVTLASGARQVVPMRGIAKEDTDRARRLGAIVSKRAREGASVTVDTSETVNEWSERWLKSREERLATVSTDRGRLSVHVLPHIGAMSIAAVTRDDIEKVVRSLDQSVLAKRIAWKTAINTWGLVTKMFKDATRSKRTELRVREDNPCTNVEGPDRGSRKAKTYLYPNEFLQLVTCEAIPLPRRRIYALAVYMFARAGELRGLHWEDVDLDRGVAHIHQALNRETRKLTTTKSGEARRIPVEAKVMPLLLALRREDEASATVTTVHGSDTHLARQLRTDLSRAGITRSELFSGDENRKAMTFHDLRSTGITWMAVRGDEPLRIMQRAGHEEFRTTQGYIREAENLLDSFGEVFPALPAVLIGPGVSVSVSAFRPPETQETPGKSWRRRESNFEHASRSTVGRVSGFSDLGGTPVC